MKIISRIKLLLFSFGVLILGMTSCFTGVESTKKITVTDVVKVGAQDKPAEENEFDGIVPENFVDWTAGKQFYVTDNNIRIILYSRSSNLDSIDFKGHHLTYNGFVEENRIGVEKRVYISLTDSVGREFFYNTGKELKELKNPAFNFKIPFTIDVDMIASVKKNLINRNVYIKSPIWFDKHGNQIDGTKFEQIKITDILPGNKVYSINLQFSYKEKIYYIYLSTKDNSVNSRLFSSLFSFDDPHKFYPQINDENWNLIKKGEICKYMTKEECQLSLGAPNDVNKRPTYNGLEEFWFYENGIYLVFTDGLLTSYRK